MDSNGQRGVRIGVTRMGEGWVYLSVDEVPLDQGHSSRWLNQALRDWLAENSTVKVRCVAPIVTGGETMSLHIWFDQ